MWGRACTRSWCRTPCCTMCGKPVDDGEMVKNGFLAVQSYACGKCAKTVANARSVNFVFAIVIACAAPWRGSTPILLSIHAIG